MPKNFVSLMLLSFSLLLSACGSSQSFTQEEKKFVHNLFLTQYLWYDQVASNINYQSFTTPNALIDALRVNPPDRWSFSLTSEEYDNFVNQKTEGFGFGFTPEFNIFLVRIGSPAYGKLFRGDKIISINGNLASTQALKSAKEKLGTPTTFTVLRNGQEEEVNITPNAYTFHVAQGKVIQQDNKNIGYLRYDSFTSTSVNELEQAFTQFKQANISDLIIDLRYNGGGSIAVASTLLDNISNTHAGERQGYLDWNANYKHKNANFYFSDEVEPNDLNMKRVIFLVTKNSASASELVISALKPYLGVNNVITIGTQTHGKNVGVSGMVYGNNYYVIINFYVRNNAGETTSSHGIAPTCS
ncbi:MAG TPA: hypothetical protein ENK98_02705, partial [Epsilonproteobacteria bacterium]|nr:hypothetical protein [Campylobacterota bacterium]